MSVYVSLPVTFHSERAYPENCFPLGICEHFCVMGKADGPHIPLDRVNGRVEELYKDDNGNLCAKVRIMDTPMGLLCQRMSGLDGYELTPVGIGTVNFNNIVGDYKLLYFSLTPTIKFDKEEG